MSGKRLLKSMLAQTGSLNRMQEEREMWRRREFQKSTHWRDFRVQEPRAMIARGRLLSDTLSSAPPHNHHHHKHRRHTSSSPEDHAHQDEKRGVRGSGEGYWTRLLLKQEENDPGRWGHSGYRELYAEDFASSEDSDSEEEEIARHKPSENGSPAKKRKRKKKKVKEVSVVRSKKRGRGLSDSTDDGEERTVSRKRKAKRLKEKRKDRRKKSKHKPS